jgi:hypothetical protein
MATPPSRPVINHVFSGFFPNFVISFSTPPLPIVELFQFDAAELFVRTVLAKLFIIFARSTSVFHVLGLSQRQASMPTSVHV